MAKFDTLFMTKMAEKPYLTYIAHVREYPPGTELGADYMANFSPVSPADIAWREFLSGPNFSPGHNSQPGFKNRAGNLGG